MAYMESGELSTDQRSYELGEYDISVSLQYNPSTDSTTCIVICVQGDKQATRRQTIKGKAEAWYVEANENTASVYVTVKENTQPLDTSPVPQPIPLTSTVTRYSGNPSWQYPQDIYRANCAMFAYKSGSGVTFIYASTAPMEGALVDERFNAVTGNPDTPIYYDISGRSYYTYADKTVYYSKFNSISIWSDPRNSPAIPNYSISDQNAMNIAWTMVYGNEIDPEPKDKLVARFSIDLGPAGGGPGGGGGSPWIEPGDWEDDWEEGDPVHTLHLEVIGALSGRHNDPLHDTSYSYLPADKDTIKPYGCGGDGGHGGGGGAGASSVVIHKFETNQANYKEVTAYARRHGYGSGGGKGGKGGDGIILVYY